MTSLIPIVPYENNHAGLIDHVANVPIRAKINAHVSNPDFKVSDGNVEPRFSDLKHGGVYNHNSTSSAGFDLYFYQNPHVAFGFSLDALSMQSCLPKPDCELLS
jgi:hypothetical protein